MGVWPGFSMNSDDIGPSFAKRGDIGIDGSDHQVHVERFYAVWPERLHHAGADRQIRHEMTVHNVDMNVVGASLVDCSDLFTKSGEVMMRDVLEKVWDDINKKYGTDAKLPPAEEN